MDIAIFSQAGGEMLLRWGHFLFGITWIGLLYYFNFVQAEFFKEADAPTKSLAIQKLVPRALWWFRWAAFFTFLTGILILGKRGGEQGMTYFTSPGGTLILIGGLMGTIMFLNVWMVIWPNQKIVIASATQVAGGGQALPEAAAAGAKALLASRTNTMLSVPMLFFMGASFHLPALASSANLGLTWIAILVILGAVQYNALKGKLGPLTTVRGVVHCGLGLLVAIYIVMEVIKAI